MTEPITVRGPGTPKAEPMRAVARGGAVNFIGALVYGASSFILLWALNHELGPRGAGILLVAIAIFNIAEKVAELGCSTGLIRFISHYRAVGTPGAIRPILRSAVVAVAVSSSAMAAVLWVLAPQVAGVFADPGDLRTVTAVVRAMAPFVPFASLHSVLIQATRGFDAMVPQTVIEKVARALALPAAVIVANRLGASIAGVAVAWAATFAAAGIATVWVLFALLRRTEHADAPIKKRLSSKPASFWRFTAARAAGQTFEVAVNWIDTLFVGALVSTTEAGIYASGTRYLLVGMFTAEALMQVCGPRVSGMLSRGESEEATEILRYATGWQVMVTWPIYLLVLGFAVPLLRVFGPEVVRAEGALLILSVGMLAYSQAGPAASVILMSGRSRTALLNTVLAVTFNVVGNLLAIPRFGMTGAGAVWAVTLMFQSWLPAIQADRSLRTTTFGRPGVLTGAMALASVGAATLVGRVAFGPTWTGLLAAATAGGFVYAALLWRARDAIALDSILPDRLMRVLGAKASA